MSGVRLDVRCSECGRVLGTEEFFSRGEMVSVSGLLEDHDCPWELGVEPDGHEHEERPFFYDISVALEQAREQER